VAVALAGTPTTSDTSASGGSTTVNVPSGAVVGEVLVAFLMAGPSAPPFSAPSGWTTLQTGHDGGAGGALDTALWLGYRVVTGTEASSYTWTYSSTSYAMGTMFRVSGADAAGTPIRTSAGKFTNTNRSQTDVGPSLSGVQATDGEFYFFAAGDDTGTNLGSFVNLSAPWTTIASRTFHYKGTYIAQATGAVAAPTATSSSSNTIWSSAAVAFEVASGGDTTPPTVPSAVTATANSATQITVAWTASTDAVGVASYRVIRNGTTVATAVAGSPFVDTTVLPSTAYAYTVSAVDAANNRSAESSTASATTPAGVVGTVTITPTVQPTNVPPAIRLDITDTRSSPAHLLTIVRNNPDGTTAVVRTGDGTPLLMSNSGATTVGLLYDYEAPYQAAVSYSTLEVPSAVSGNVTLNVSVPWLVHPGIPSLSRPIQLLRGSLAQVTYKTTRGVFYPLGRTNAVVVTDGARKGGSSTVILRVTTPPDLSALMNLLADASPLLLNLPSTTGYTFPTSYISPSDVTTAPTVTGLAVDPDMAVTIPFDVVDAPIGGNQAERTLADLMSFPSLAVLAGAYPTLLAVLAGP
jgi:chitodextrinase